MSLAIRTDRIGKRFSRGAARRWHGLRETVEQFARSPARALARSRQEHFLWALREVSFEVQTGEQIALLGRNGAGKSVLLKILSRVTAPTEGSAVVSGRIAPLLEVGAGFHPELSGRQNVFFNGAILGMPRDQIRRKFDEIVAFSAMEQFIDTPVKLYSSGMRMRLAFSVAVHLEPDVLLIDEALSVGDAGFRAQCRQKIREFIARGCTLLLVSHDAAVLRDLCSRGIALTGGRMLDDGPIASVLDRYMDPGTGSSG